MDNDAFKIQTHKFDEIYFNHLHTPKSFCSCDNLSIQFVTSNCYASQNNDPFKQNAKMHWGFDDTTFSSLAAHSH